MKVELVDVLRFPLIMLVLFVHTIPESIVPVTFNLDVESCYIWVTEILSHHLGRVAVPLFFTFSGYFYFLKVSDFTLDVYRKQSLRRVYSLIVPYLLWNIIFLAAILVKNFIFIKYSLTEDEMYSLLRHASFYDLFWKNPLLFPFWYIRDLIVMSFLSPLFYYFFSITKKYGLFLLVLLYISTLELNVPGFSSTAITFFGMGAYLGVNKHNLTNLLPKFNRLKIPLAIFLLLMATLKAGTLHYELTIRLFILSGVIAALHIGLLLTRRKLIKKKLLALAPTVFFIYAAHSVYLINWIKGFFYNSQWYENTWYKLVSYLSIPFLTVTVCLLLYMILKKLLPRFTCLLTGQGMIVKISLK